MKFPVLFKATSAAPSWPWPSCVSHPKTLSFRAIPEESFSFESNSINHPKTLSFRAIPGESFSFESNSDDVEFAVMRGLRSNRLFFEPGETSSILYNERVGIMEMESRAPFVDFRVSMEEMVEAHDWIIKDWECLEKLLEWYLRVNDKSNHGCIIGAFEDLLIHLFESSNCASATQYSFTSPLSFCSSISSPSQDQNEDP